MTEDNNIQLDSYSRAEKLQFCRIVANMVGADHKVTGEEQTQLAILVWQTGLSMFEEDVAEVINKELAQPSPLADLVKGIENPELRRWLYRVMIEVALADNELAPEEETKLLEMADLFSFNSQAAQDLINWTKDSIHLERREEEIMSRL